MKKILSLVLVFALICPLFAVSASAQTKADEYLLLKGLCVTNSEIESMDQDAPITRAQYAYMLAKLMGYNDEINYGDSSFTDVKDGLYSGAIYFLKSNGVVKGSASHLFNPDGYVTIEAAYLMSARAMGYDALMGVKYSGEEAIILIAKDAGISDGVTVNDKTQITLSEACLILANTATNPMLYQVSFGDEISYNTTNNSLLSVYSDLIYAEGIMTDSGVTSIGGEDANSSGKVVIAGIEMKNKLFDDAYKLIGKNVEFFYTADKEIIYAIESENNSIVIDAKDILPATTIDDVVYYTESGKTKTAKLDPYAKMVYNGYTNVHFKADDIKIKAGKLTLTDNNNDKAYDIIVAEEYKDFVSGGFSDGVIVTDENPIDIEKYSFAYVYDSEGNAIKAEDVSSGAILTVYESLDKQVVSVYVNNKGISGTVTKIGEENGNDVYYIGEDTYTLSYTLSQKIKSNRMPELSIGKGYNFTLNIFGEISDYKELSDTEWTLAYCVGIAPDNTSGLSSSVVAKMVTDDGIEVTPRFAEKVIVNGKGGIKSKDLLSSRYFFDADGDALRQPVKIKVNGDGYIKAIEVPEDKTNSKYGFDTSVFSYDKNLKSGLYRGSSSKRSIDGYILKTTTILIEDPYYNTSNSEGKTDDVKFYKVSGLPSESNFSEVRFYDLDHGMQPDIMVYKTRSITNESSIFLVENVVSVLDKEGNRIKRVSGFANGSYIVYDELEQGIVPDTIKRGDVCQYAIEGAYLAGISKVLSLDENTKPFADAEVIDKKWANLCGYLYSKTASSVVVVAPESYTASPLIGSTLGTGAKVVVYDLNKDEMHLGNINDVYTDFIPDNEGNFELTENSTMIYIKRTYDQATEIVVLKK